MFDLQNNKGFTMTFDNGWTISVKWGDGNYSDNYHYQASHSRTAEIAIWDDKGEWYVFERKVYDEGTEDEFVSEHTVKGWLSPNEVLVYMNEIANK